MALKIHITNQLKDVHLALEGALDENCMLPEFAEAITGTLTIDLSQVHTINSLGCRKWTQWIKDKAHADKGVTLINCSPAIVAQFNVLIGFLPDSVAIESFFVPYTCESCAHEERVLLTQGQEFDRTAGIIQVREEVPCPQCKNMMTMDAIKARYFKFLMRKSA